MGLGSNQSKSSWGWRVRIAGEGLWKGVCDHLVQLLRVTQEVKEWLGRVGKELEHSVWESER